MGRPRKDVNLQSIQKAKSDIRQTGSNPSLERVSENLGVHPNTVRNRVKEESGMDWNTHNTVSRPK
jgi:hypothetical protein